MTYKIPLSYTPIDELELASVLEQYSGKPHSDLISDFEKKIASITGARYVVALNSGTAAIHMALKALEVGAGDEVMVSTFTYVASVNPILYQGAIPVFIESEPDTWNMDPAILEQAIMTRAKKPKAIIVVHGYGMPAKMESILEIAKKYSVPVIEDAAEALGSSYHGRHLGTLTEVGMLSFNNNKIVTTYGGGALLTNSETIYKQVLHWASQSREDKPYYEHIQIGYNYRMSPLNAACGLANLPELDQLIADKRRVLEGYRKEFEENQSITILKEEAGSFANHWLTTILIKLPPGINIHHVRLALEERGIESRLLWKPMHLQTLYKDVDFYGSDVSEGLFREGLCLPSGQTLTSDDIKVISGIILEILKRAE